MLRADYHHPLRSVGDSVIVRGEELRYSSEDQANQVQKTITNITSDDVPKMVTPLN